MKTQTNTGKRHKLIIAAMKDSGGRLMVWPSFAPIGSCGCKRCHILSEQMNNEVSEIQIKCQLTDENQVC